MKYVKLLKFQHCDFIPFQFDGNFIIFFHFSGGLCGFSKENGLVPVSKNMWSISFVFTMSSMAFFLLTLMYLLIDVWQLWEGSPFYYAGMNSIGN